MFLSENIMQPIFQQSNFSPSQDPVLSRNLQVIEVGYDQNNNDWNYTHTYSLFWRLYYNRTGSHRIQWEDQTVEFGEDYAILVPERLLFLTEGNDSAEHLWIHFNWPIAMHVLNSEPTKIHLDHVSLSLIDNLQSILSEKPVDMKKHYHGTMAFLHYLFSSIDGPAHQVLPEGILLAIQLMSEDYKKKVPVNDLAAHAGMSLPTFHRQFKKYLGHTPAAYLLEKRLQEAARLLLHTHEAVDNIADECGFANRFHFSRAFKEMHGVAPAAFRREHGVYSAV